jgi:hypothetical protein
MKLNKKVCNHIDEETRNLCGSISPKWGHRNEPATRCQKHKVIN